MTTKTESPSPNECSDDTYHFPGDPGSPERKRRYSRSGLARRLLTMGEWLTTKDFANALRVTQSALSTTTFRLLQAGDAVVAHRRRQAGNRRVYMHIRAVGWTPPQTPVSPSSATPDTTEAC